MKKYVLMVAAAMCLAVAAPASISKAQPMTEQIESGLLLRIFNEASVAFAKAGISYTVAELSQGYKAGTVTASELPGGNGWAVGAGGDSVIVVLEDMF